MKKLIIFISVLFATIGVAKGADSLFQYYSEKSQPLPPISERPYEKIGIENPTGLYNENVALLNYLQGGSFSLGSGGGTAITDFESTLTIPLTTATTSIAVASMDTTDGHTLVTADIEPTIYLILEAESPNKKEIAKCTGISGLYFTGCTRGLAFYGRTETAVTANKKSHSAGTTITVSNVHYYYLSANDANTWTAEQTFRETVFDLFPTSGLGTTLPTSSTQFATKLYVDGVGAGGFTSSNVDTNYGLRVFGTSPETVGVATSSLSGLRFDNSGHLQVATSSGTGIYVDTDDVLKVSTTTNYLWTGNATTSGSVVFSGDANLTGTTTMATTTLDKLVINDELVFNGDTDVIEGISHLATSTAATTTVANSSSETTIFSRSIPANTLGIDGVIKVKLNISDVDSTSGHNPTYRLKYGATTLIAKLHSMSAMASFTGYIEVELIAANSTGEQKGSLTYIFGNGATTINMGGETGTSNEDSTTDKTLTITIAVGSADATDSFSVGSAYMQVIK